ncbi:amidase [Paenibacillus urinalis]|uniref:Amidase n=1 Tax=Paenibacillus urinalis TaxID=521520 RepID=A0AAX3N646_9BACL|nr:amidase [Paenibacillus urinalis]WDH85296.1 amidase [Paenibacillus urinalis]WDH98403.1 amidase [Paenibacillus urinalis]WDI02093.1 amidase [Paenibacillus urinalis]
MPRNDQWTIAAAGRAFRSGELSPVQLLESLLQRIRNEDDRYRSFLHLMEDEARAQAAQAERELRDGRDRGPLHGIPVSVKDMIAYAGVPLTNGSGRSPVPVPEAHARVVAKLLEAGSVIIGKAHLYEFAYGRPHPAFGWTLNPLRPGRLPGGSSSGSAAGIAAGFALGSIGTDSAGSVRVPASFCGVAGFKPSAGRLSLDGITPLAPSLDHAGVLARTCEDVSLLFNVLAERSDEKGTRLMEESAENRMRLNVEVEQPGIRARATEKPLTIGVATDYLDAEAEPEIRDAILGVVQTMEKAGFRVKRLNTELPISEVKEKTWTILHYEAYRTHTEKLTDWAKGYSERMRNSLEAGRAITTSDYDVCLSWRDSHRSLVDSLFEEIDVLVSPTCPVTAGPIPAGKPGGPANGEFTPLANLWGLPALSLPAGLSSEGLPIGLQLTGRRGDDELVLAAGSLFERFVRG